MSSNPHEQVISSQMTAIDASDSLASQWEDALDSISQETSFKQQSLIWGGKGKGGRGISRRTIQPKDVIVDDVNLEYVSDANSGAVGSKTLLAGADLKLLSGKVYAMIGRNGCGKSTLLRRMAQKKIPGFTSLHLKMMHVPQEVFEMDNELPIDVVIGCTKQNLHDSNEALQCKIEALEEELEALDLECPEHGEENVEKMENICAEISKLEDSMQQDGGNDLDSDIRFKAEQVLEYFGIPKVMQSKTMDTLSGGQRKKVLLACSLFCDLDLLLLDEPTNHLDMKGIIQLRGLISTMQQQETTVVLVSHDINLINCVASDVIHFANHTLTYYRGNYVDYLIAKEQHDLHKTRQQQTLDKQRDAMMKTIDNLKKKSNSASREGKKKLNKSINSRKKKLERHGIENDEHGHRLTVQDAKTGMKLGSINSLDASTRKKLGYKALVQKTQKISPVPDKAVQFSFKDTNCTWGEPLIQAFDVGHGYDIETTDSTTITESLPFAKKPGFLFDSIDLSIEEHSTVCILGENGTGKTTLLKILCKEIKPLEGEVHTAHNATISFFSQHKADELITDGVNKYGSNTCSIALLSQMYPKKTEQDIRGTLIDFGLSPEQASTYIQFLSGGERCRLCLAMIMLQDPHVLVFDEPTTHLDPESVEALVYGIQKWNGTFLMVSHDLFLIQMLEGTCYVLTETDGKLRRLEGGIDSYLNILGKDS